MTGKSAWVTNRKSLRCEKLEERVRGKDVTAEAEFGKKWCRGWKDPRDPSHPSKNTMQFRQPLEAGKSRDVFRVSRRNTALPTHFDL